MGLLILSSMHLPARDVEPRSRVDASGVCGVGSILGLNRYKRDWTFQRVHVQGDMCGERSVAEKGLTVISSHFTDLLRLTAPRFLVN